MNSVVFRDKAIMLEIQLLCYAKMLQSDALGVSLLRSCSKLTIELNLVNSIYNKTAPQDAYIT